MNKNILRYYYLKNKFTGFFHLRIMYWKIMKMALFPNYPKNDIGIKEIEVISINDV